MNQYEELYKKSNVSHTTKKRKLVIVDREKFDAALDMVCGIVLAVTIVAAGTSFTINNQLKTEMMMSAASELQQAGYQNYGPKIDERYYLTEDIDLFDLYLVLPQESFDTILKSRGYESLEDFYSKNGYENFDEWQKEAKNNFKEERAERRGNK